MTLDELLAEVYNITNRPDLSTLSTAQVKAATLKAHSLDFFNKDIFEQGGQFEVAAFRQSLDYLTIITNFRKLKYIKRVESATDDVGKFFTILSVDEILDSYGVNRNDIAYVAGRSLEIRSSVSFQFFLQGSYVFPLVTTTGFSSWVAEQYPYAIIFQAASVVLKSIDQVEEGNAIAKLLQRDPKRPQDPPGEYDILRTGELTDVGF